MRRLLLPLILFASFTSLQAQEANEEQFYQGIEIPLDAGHIHAGKLLGRLAEQAGVDGALLSSLIDVKIDMSSTTGKITMKALEFATRKIMKFDVETKASNQVLAIRIDRFALRRNRVAFQKRLMQLIDAWYPDAAAKVNTGLGLFLHPAEGPAQALGEETKLPKKAVLLVHGLDEPGHVWNLIAPTLVKEKWTVIEARYPNDQAIEKSALLLAEWMTKLRAAGVEEIDIIAHSMGGLVCREMLTHSKLYGGNGQGHVNYPAVHRLILAGTPNQGARLAEVQALGDVRETVMRMLSGDGHLFGAFFDGAGEAKEDLLPGSPFLQRLNARPLPSNVKITILASRASPVSPQQIDALKAKIKVIAPDYTAEAFEKLSESLKGLIDGAGDGAVSIDSTKIEGVEDVVIVTGNHTSMMRKESGTEATVMGEILKRLGAPSR